MNEHIPGLVPQSGYGGSDHVSSGEFIRHAEEPFKEIRRKCDVRIGENELVTVERQTFAFLLCGAHEGIVLPNLVVGWESHHELPESLDKVGWRNGAFAPIDPARVEVERCSKGDSIEGSKERQAAAKVLYPPLKKRELGRHDVNADEGPFHMACLQGRFRPKYR